MSDLGCHKREGDEEHIELSVRGDVTVQPLPRAANLYTYGRRRIWRTEAERAAHG